MEVTTLTISRDLDCAPFYLYPANLTTFANLDGLGLTAIGQRLTPKKAEILCQVTNPDPWCQTCGTPGNPRDTVTRRLAHEPFGWRPPSW